MNAGEPAGDGGKSAGNFVVRSGRTCFVKYEGTKAHKRGVSRLETIQDDAWSEVSHQRGDPSELCIEWLCGSHDHDTSSYLSSERNVSLPQRTSHILLLDAHMSF